MILTFYLDSRTLLIVKILLVLALEDHFNSCDFRTRDKNPYFEVLLSINHYCNNNYQIINSLDTIQIVDTNICDKIITDKNF